MSKDVIDMEKLLDKDDKEFFATTVVEPNKELIRNVVGVSNLDMYCCMSIMELCAEGLFKNMRRDEIIDYAIQLVEEKYPKYQMGIDYTKKHLYNIYNSTRRQVFKVRVDTVEGEKKKYLENMMRLARKAEAANDFKVAKECYKDIAKLLGVFEEKDDSKIILNFTKAIKSS